jgi:hypothetical protein
MCKEFELKDCTEIAVILDRSGSMQDAKNDHEGGLNSFVEDQRQLEGAVNFTLIQFDSVNPCEVMYDGVPISEVRECKLLPRGGTPLLDAVGQGIAHLDKRFSAMGEQPEQIIVMVITDGEENSSREFTKQRVKDMVAEHEKKGNWKFLFLGANIDAFHEGGGLGFTQGATGGYQNKGPQVHAMYAALSSNTKRSRGMRSQGVDVEEYTSALNFSPTQLNAMSEDSTAVPPGLNTTFGVNK